MSRPESREALADELRRAAEEPHRLVLPRGEGTRMRLGAPPARIDTLILTGGLDRVVAWEPGDLTVSVESGVRLETLGTLLASRKQYLPLQSDRAGGTIGGLLAAGEDGCLAFGAGRIRDFLIGASVALGDGTIAKGRGAVVKNVAGYDVPRLLVGSLGTLGVIVEASFKLLPLPEAHATVVSEHRTLAEAFAAARAVLDSPAEPVFVNVLRRNESASDGLWVRLVVGLQGPAERVRGLAGAIRDRLAGTESAGTELREGDDNTVLRRALDDPAAAAAERMGVPEPVVVKCLSLPSEQAALAERLCEMGSRLPARIRLDARPGLGVLYVVVDEAGDGAAAAAILVEARSGGRPAVLVSAPAALRAGLDVWGPPPADFFLMEAIKKAFDPPGVFAPGRFVGGL